MTPLSGPNFLTNFVGVWWGGPQLWIKLCYEGSANSVCTESAAEVKKDKDARVLRPKARYSAGEACEDSGEVKIKIPK